MSLKDLLVCLDGTDAGIGRLHLAAQLARHHQARLSAVAVLSAETIGSPIYDPGALSVGVELGAGFPQGSLIAGQPTAQGTPDERQATASEILEDRFREALRASGIQGDWLLFDRSDTDEMIELAKAADLTILGQVSPDAPHAAAFPPDEIALACGRPLLVVPYAGSFASVGKRVLVAWDASREAVRAINDALPLMAGAEEVTVLVIGRNEHDLDNHRAACERIARHLARHGLPARPAETVRDGIAVSDALLSRASDLGADLIVAGVYHHSRLREALLGGVSRELLQHMTVPVLMSH